MRAVIQRVTSAQVAIEKEIVGQISHGLLVLIGISRTDTTEDTVWLTRKILAQRIFADEEGRLNRSVIDINGEILAVSQFTLIASTRKGTRPSFNEAAPPEIAVPLYEQTVQQLSDGLGRTIATGKFGADMKVSLVNNGPVTLIIDSRLRE